MNLHTKEIAISLFDVDKISQDRNNPRPNSHDVLPQRPNYGTLSTQYQSTPQSQTGGFVKMQNQSVIANDGSTNRALFGFNKNTGTWGVFAVTAGNDVLTATKYALDSDYDQFKIVGKFTYPFSESGGGSGMPGSLGPLIHGLGYQPLFTGSINITSASGAASIGVFPLPYVIFGINSTIANGVVPAGISIGEVGDTDVYFNFVLGPGSAFTGTITLYAIQETAT